MVMMWGRLATVFRTAFAIALVGVAIGQWARGEDLPAPRGYVNDFAGVLDAESQARMEAMIRRVRSRMDVEIAVVTVPSLGGMPIEDYAIELARRWGIGRKGADTGVLILVAPNERRWRIEVGYGLEGELPDGLVGEVGRRMVPYFRERKYGEGLQLGLQTIVATLAQKRGVTIEEVDPSLAYVPERRSSRAGLGLVVLLLVLFVLAFVLAATTGTSGRRGGRARRLPPYRDSDWLWYPIIFSGGGSGGFGGHIGGSSHRWGGFGGGGFGGFGGGSFGGGGASGSW
jgi:uncharacterized protein